MGIHTYANKQEIFIYIHVHTHIYIYIYIYIYSHACKHTHALIYIKTLEIIYI